VKSMIIIACDEGRYISIECKETIKNPAYIVIYDK